MPYPVLRLVRKLGRFALYGGFGGPKPHESLVLEATADALPDDEANVLRRQVALVERLQRWTDDRMVIVGFEDRNAVPRLRNDEPNHTLAKLRLKGASGSVTAYVMTHRGLLSSLEFRPSPRKLGGAVAVAVVELTSDDPEVAREIDAEEHGGLP